MDAETLVEQVRNEQAAKQKVNEEEAAESERLRIEAEAKEAEELAKFDTDYLSGDTDTDTDAEAEESVEVDDSNISNEAKEGLEKDNALDKE